MECLPTFTVRRACDELPCGACPLGPLHAGGLEVENRYVPEGLRLYRAGEAGEHFYHVVRGQLKLVRYLPDGQQRIVRLLGPGDLFGLEVLLDSGYRHHAWVVRGALLCRLPAAAVRRAADADPALKWNLLGHWQRALEAADTWLTHFATGTARQRVARMLLWFAERGHGRLEIDFTREEMGAMLGLTAETVSRVMAEFQRGGGLRRRGRSGLSCDCRQLARMAGEM